MGSKRKYNVQKSEFVNIDEDAGKTIVFQDDVNTGIDKGFPIFYHLHRDENTSCIQISQKQEQNNQQSFQSNNANSIVAKGKGNDDVSTLELSDSVNTENVNINAKNSGIIKEIINDDAATLEQCAVEIIKKVNIKRNISLVVDENITADVNNTLEDKEDINEDKIVCDEMENDEYDIFNIDYDAVANEYAAATRHLKLEEMRIKIKKKIDEQNVVKVIYRAEDEDSEKLDKLKHCESDDLKDFENIRGSKKELSIENVGPNYEEFDITKCDNKEVTGEINKCSELKIICVLCRTPFKRTEKLKKHMEITHPVVDLSSNSLYSMQVNNSKEVLINYKTARNWQIYVTPKVYLDSICFPSKKNYKEKEKTVKKMCKCQLNK